MARKRKNLTDYDQARYRSRFTIVVSLISCAVCVIMIKLWYLQIVKGDELRRRSENNRIRVQEVKPLRGLITDRAGRILVDNQPSFDVSIIPEDAKDMTVIAARLDSLFEERQMEQCRDVVFAPGRKPFVPVKIDRHIEREKLAVIETNAIDLPGVVVDVIPVRKYNYDEMLAHVLGYVGEISTGELKENNYSGYKPDDIVGKEGIEKTLDRYLKGYSGGEQIEVNVAGRKLRVLGRVDPVPGHNIQLTIDAALQKICWNAFEEPAGAAIVMDPRDGSILAMMSKPSFDPAQFNRGITEENWRQLLEDPLSPLQNRAISGQYPPGSTYKVIVAAAALEERLLSAEKQVYCSGSFTLGDRTYRCWKKEGHGQVDLERAIIESCDVYFYTIGASIGVDTLAEYAGKFGLGRKTGICLPAEREGLIPTKQWKVQKMKEPWQKGETISVSIGQGFVLLTPLQLINAYCAVANGGTLFKPRLVNRIETVTGEVISEYPPEAVSKIPADGRTLRFLKDALWGVVNDDRGTGKALRRDERDVCGKTGTAQVIGMPEDEEDLREESVPYNQRDHALFVCFAPRQDPEVAVLVIVEHGGHGGAVAAPVARKIIDGYFALKKVRSDNGVGKHGGEEAGKQVEL